MSPADAEALAVEIRSAREHRGFSLRGLAQASGVNISTVMGLERADVPSPQPDTLRLLAQALDMYVADLFLVAGWLPSNQLPNLRPYLRGKYHDLNEQQISDVEHYVQHVRAICSCPSITAN